MKKAVILLIIILFLSCNNDKKTVTSEKPKTQNFNWILGEWERTNDEQGKKTYENWTKVSQLKYVGLGFTMKGNDTISSESMQLINKNNNWKLLVSTIGKGDDTSVTTFKMTQQDPKSFSFENKEIDFPKLISYTMEGKKLKAIISGGDLKIHFEFERIKM